MSGSNKSSNDVKDEEISNAKYNCVPAHKVIVKDINKLEIANINSSDLMKNASIKCQSLSNFLTFYQTLKRHFSNYNVFIRSVHDITSEAHSEPAGIIYTSDVANLMKNVTQYLLSKEGFLQIFQTACKHWR